jgi:hypothetical protein
MVPGREAAITMIRRKYAALSVGEEKKLHRRWLYENFMH